MLSRETRDFPQLPEVSRKPPELGRSHLTRRQSQIPLWLATVALLLMFALASFSMVQKSPTFDEQGFITRGLGYLLGENHHMRVGHPLGLNALNAVFLAFDSSVQLPTDHPSWRDTNFHRPSELFMWEIGNDVERVMFLARLPTIWLGLLLAAISGRWAGELTGNRWAGLLALTLIALDPNILAHSQLATTDLGLAAAAALAGFTLWRFLRKPGWRRALIAGAAFGLLQNTKFTAALFFPLFALSISVTLLLAWLSQRNDRRKKPSPFDSIRTGSALLHTIMLPLLIAYPLAAFLTLWAAYGFQIGTLPADLPVLSELSGRTLPLAHHLEQLLDISGRLQKSTPAFLLGQYSDHGWWYYFPIAFFLKTPLPTLLLLLWGFSVAGWRLFTNRLSSPVEVERKETREETIERSPSPLLPFSPAPLWPILLIPPLGYMAIALTSEINLGYRHLLPMLPFLFVFTAVALFSGQPSAFSLQPSAFSLQPSRFTFHVSRFAFIGWLGLSTVLIYPHFLAYFNALAGGPDNGWRALVDSNLDWGQDLVGLKRWIDDNQVDHVWLSYFGEARPAYYGIRYTGLDSFPPRLMNPDARPFYPHDPAPGTYAISATNLQGVLFQNHDQFAWFRERQPVDKVGYSIFIYEVLPYGRPVELLLSGVQLDEIPPEDFERLATNAVTPHWFDLQQSLLLSDRSNVWLATGEHQTADPVLEPFFASVFTAIEGAGGRYFQMDSEMARTLSAFTAGWQPVSEKLVQEEEAIRFDAFFIEKTTVDQGDETVILTLWRQVTGPRPVKIFIHVLDEDDGLIAQWDGLGAQWEGWRPGSWLLQVHRIPLAASPGRYQLWAGLYDPVTLLRWQTGAADRIFLGEVAVR